MPSRGKNGGDVKKVLKRSAEIVFGAVRAEEAGFLTICAKSPARELHFTEKHRILSFRPGFRPPGERTNRRSVVKNRESRGEGREKRQCSVSGGARAPYRRRGSKMAAVEAAAPFAAAVLAS